METIDPRILAMATSAAFFVQILVDILKSAISNEQHRQWALPLCGIVLSIAVVEAIQMANGVAYSPQVMAGSVLAGLLAYSLAAGGNALHKAARKPKQAIDEDRAAAVKRARAVIAARDEAQQA